MPEYVIETHGLTRFFGAKAAVDGVDLRVPRGSVCALVGRNGAGKSTLIKLLLGLLRPTRGESTVLGTDSRQLDPRTRSRIGYMAEGHPLVPWMSLGRVGQMMSGFYPRWDMPRFNRLIEYFQLEMKQTVRSLSRGERAQLAFALALAQRAELLILDDPTLGLDPIVRRELIESIIELLEAGADRDGNLIGGATVLLSTHQFLDVERLADRIVILDGGVVRADCEVDEFRAHVKRVHLTYAAQLPDSSALEQIPGLLRVQQKGQELTLAVAGYDESLERLLRGTGAARLAVEDMSLEDAFINFTSPRKVRSLAAVVLGEDAEGDAP